MVGRVSDVGVLAEIPHPASDSVFIGIPAPRQIERNLLLNSLFRFEHPGVYNGTRLSARRRSSRLTSPQILHLSAARCGAVAHQGERILCKDEVGGSSPPSSTRAVPFDYRGSRVPRAMNPSAVIPREGGNLAVHARTRGYRDTRTAMKQMEPQGEGVLTALAAPERARMERPVF